jgi:phosphonate degradation associated HDIG domain protein
MRNIDDIFEGFVLRGAAAYGERVSQLAHALQAAQQAEREGADEALVAAALLHDIGHLVAKAPVGTDDRHEQIAAGLLERLFGSEVAEPVRLHVDAKRYLCATESGYFRTLSPASVASLALQGGPFTAEGAATFAARPYADDAVRLRRWDERAKDPAAVTKPLESYAPLLRRLAR